MTEKEYIKQVVHLVHRDRARSVKEQQCSGVVVGCCLVLAVFVIISAIITLN